MPIYHRTYSPGELPFITTSTYQRAPVFFSSRFCGYFVQRLEGASSADHRLCGPRLFGCMFAEGRSRRTADRKNGGPRYLLWNRRFHPFNVHTEEKRREKLNYMHNNPVKRGLVSSPGDWPWSRGGGEVLFPGRCISPAYGPAGLSRPPERVPSGHRRPHKPGSAPARPARSCLLHRFVKEIDSEYGARCSVLGDRTVCRVNDQA